MTVYKKKKKYFALYEICFLSLMAALVYVFKTYFKTPIGLSGHNGLIWVIPFIIAVGVTRKFGSASYVGLLSGLLIGTIGMSDEGVVKVFEWFAMGVAIDFLGFIFKNQLGNVAVGFLIGAFGNVVKGLVNFSIGIFLTPNAHIILLGFGPAILFHLIFGGLGGILAAIIFNRIKFLRFPNRAQEEKQKATNLPNKIWIFE